MARVTLKQLENKVSILNEAKGLGENPAYSTIGAYDLDYAYGGVKLVEYTSKGGSQRSISPNGFGTKKELYIFLQGMTVNL